MANKIKPLVTVTGMPSADLFNTYVTPEGKGAPIVVVYEHLALTGCTTGTRAATRLRVLASPELADMQPLLDDPGTGAWLWIDCDTGGPRRRVPDGPFLARCLGRVERWDPLTREMVIDPIAVFK